MRPAADDGSKAASWLSPAILAWSIASLCYFYQYALRSAPAVMVPLLAEAFGVTAAGLSTLIGLFYYGYAPFSLVAGIAMDRLGPRRLIPIAATAMGCGAFLFATGDPIFGAIGVFVQGAAAVFAFVAAVFIATTRFPSSQAATLIGLTQMFGMAGGSAGLFLVGPAIAAGLAWNQFWLLMGLTGIALALVQLAFNAKEQPGAAEEVNRTGKGMGDIAASFRAVFSNPQSILCGVIAGLLFTPTTIFGMVWGVQFLQEAHSLPYTVAVLRSASVPVGWIIGAPLLGMLSDRIGRRKPVVIGGALVLFGCLSLILFGRLGWLPPYSLGLLAGIASGAAMLPYIIIKEANRPEHSGTATGVISFINFSLSALLGPLFGTLLARASNDGTRGLADYQAVFTPLLYVVAVAIVLAFFLRETGPASAPSPAPASKSRHRSQSGMKYRGATSWKRNPHV